MSNHFVSADRMIGVEISDAAYATMLGAASLAGRKETGGILVGHYSAYLDRAIVETATGPPSDSQAFAASFIRGVSGLRRLLLKAWRGGNYYLGEWHFHPFASPDPSPTDILQLVTFARDPGYQCPNPVLVIIGGDPVGAWRLRVTALADAGVTVLDEAAPR